MSVRLGVLLSIGFALAVVALAYIGSAEPKHAEAPAPSAGNRLPSARQQRRLLKRVKRHQTNRKAVRKKLSGKDEGRRGPRVKAKTKGAKKRNLRR